MCCTASDRPPAAPGTSRSEFEAGRHGSTSQRSGDHSIHPFKLREGAGNGRFIILSIWSFAIGWVLHRFNWIQSQHFDKPEKQFFDDNKLVSIGSCFQEI